MGSLSLHQGISQPRDPTQVSHIVGRFSTSWATRKAHVSLPFFPVHEKDCNNSISSRNYNNSPSMYSSFWLSHHSDTTISQARAFFIWSYKWRNSAYENNILLDNHFPVCVNPFRKPPHKRQFSFQHNQILWMFLSDNTVCIGSSHTLHIYRGNFCLEMPSELTELMINLSFRVIFEILLASTVVPLIRHV